MPALIDRTATIAASDTKSSGFGTGLASRGSFQLPSDFTGTNCAIEGSFTDVDAGYTAVAVEGNESATMTVAAGKTYAFPVKTFNYKFIRLVVDAQATAQVVNIFTRD